MATSKLQVYAPRAASVQPRRDPDTSIYVSLVHVRVHTREGDRYTACFTRACVRACVHTCVRACTRASRPSGMPTSKCTRTRSGCDSCDAKRVLAHLHPGQEKRPACLFLFFSLSSPGHYARRDKGTLNWIFFGTGTNARARLNWAQVTLKFILLSCI